MENNNKILQELQDISPLLISARNSNPYKVAFSYFDNLADSIIEKIRSEAEPSFSFSKENVYNAPAGYFDSLSASIVQQIKEKTLLNEVFEEMETISPLLNTISKKPVYTVPEGYFEKAEWNDLMNGNTARVVKPAKIISLAKSRKVVRYVAAAAIIGSLAIGSFLFNGKQNTLQQATATNEQAASEVKTLSEQEIVDFLKTTSPGENIALTTSGTLIKDNDIKNSVSEMSDAEIQRFLQENGEADEM